MNVIDHPSRGQLMARILLAEDDEDMRHFLERALGNAGYDVVSFNNGRDAYDRLREEPFQLLLTDIVMPEMDGDSDGAAGGAHARALQVVPVQDLMRKPHLMIAPSPYNVEVMSRPTAKHSRDCPLSAMICWQWSTIRSI